MSLSQPAFSRRRAKERIGKISRYFLAALVALMVVFPFYISTNYSLKHSHEITVNRLTPPGNPTLENYTKVLTQNKQFGIGFRNTVITTIPTVLILLFTTSMAAFALARGTGKGYQVIYNVFLAGILIPFQCIMLPIYLNLSKMNLTSTATGFIIARAGLQISISILVVTGFVKTVPLELEEAAGIDGCNMFQTFWRVVFPLMTPVNVTQMVLNTLFVWNDYNVAVVLLRKSESQTLPLAQILYFNENTSELNLAFAFFTMAMLPILILYLCMQRYIVSGIMAGAVKG